MYSLMMFNISPFILQKIQHFIRLALSIQEYLQLGGICGIY